MTSTSWEHQREVRDALRTIVSDPQLGVAALSSAQTMSNLLKDLLPDAPRETSVLVAAAEAGLAQTLQDRVGQGMDLATASSLTASAFAARTPFTADACNWAVAELAVALGLAPDQPAPAGETMVDPGQQAAGPAAQNLPPAARAAGDTAETLLPAGPRPPVTATVRASRAALARPRPAARPARAPDTAIPGLARASTRRPRRPRRHPRDTFTRRRRPRLRHRPRPRAPAMPTRRPPLLVRARSPRRARAGCRSRGGAPRRRG